MKPLRVGFTLIGGGHWSGGLNYQRSLFQLMSGPLAARMEARLFVSPDQATLATDTFGMLLKVPPIVDSRVAGAGVGRRAAAALATGNDSAFAALVSAHEIDVMFEHARFFGAGFPVPLLAWMPDFQHRHLAHLFSAAAWWKRDIGFRAQCSGRRLVLLSSESARRDAETFFPRIKGRTAVVRFTGKLDAADVFSRVGDVRRKYSLPERFIYLPNQFWVHKNHALVLAALRHVRTSEGSLASVLPVVMSGPTVDDRDAGYFLRCMTEAESQGLAPWLRHLGLIPYGDVLALNAGAEAVLNPSLFEGWASSVEEAKSLGTPVILSDIDVHREQAPDALFFGASDTLGLARHLENICRAAPRVLEDAAMLHEKNRVRLDSFEAAFAAAVEAAARLDPRSSARLPRATAGS